MSISEKDIGKLVVKFKGNNGGLYSLIGYGGHPVVFLESEKKCSKCGHGRRVMGAVDSPFADYFIPLEELLEKAEKISK